MLSVCHSLCAQQTNVNHMKKENTENVLTFQLSWEVINFKTLSSVSTEIDPNSINPRHRVLGNPDEWIPQKHSTGLNIGFTFS